MDNYHSLLVPVSVGEGQGLSLFYASFSLALKSTTLLRIFFFLPTGSKLCNQK